MAKLPSSQRLARTTAGRSAGDAAFAVDGYSLRRPARISRSPTEWRLLDVVRARCESKPLAACFAVRLPTTSKPSNSRRTAVSPHRAPCSAQVPRHPHPSAARRRQTRRPPADAAPAAARIAARRRVAAVRPSSRFRFSSTASPSSIRGTKPCWPTKWASARRCRRSPPCGCSRITATSRRVLLVCPKPLVTNWQREFAVWAPELPRHGRSKAAPSGGSGCGRTAQRRRDASPTTNRSSAIATTSATATTTSTWWCSTSRSGSRTARAPPTKSSARSRAAAVGR